MWYHILVVMTEKYNARLEKPDFVPWYSIVNMYWSSSTNKLNLTGQQKCISGKCCLKTYVFLQFSRVKYHRVVEDFSDGERSKIYLSYGWLDFLPLTSFVSSEYFPQGEYQDFASDHTCSVYCCGLKFFVIYTDRSLRRTFNYSRYYEFDILGLFIVFICFWNC